MNPGDIPFDVGFYFDDDLREVPDSPADMRHATAFLQAQLDSREQDVDERRAVLGLLGVYERMLGELDAAEGHLGEAVQLALDSDNREAVAVSQLRLAHVYQWQGAFTQADHIFEDVIRRCEQEPILHGYLDFACQHYGKSLYDQGRYAEAATFFNRALGIRLASGNQELIASTRLALDRTKAMER